MSGTIIGLLLTGVPLIALAVFHRWHSRRPYHKQWDNAFLLSVMLVNTSIVAGLFTLGFTLGVSYEESVCASYSEAASRPVRWERHGFWDWECLVETDEGWVDRHQIIKVDD